MAGFAKQISDTLNVKFRDPLDNLSLLLVRLFFGSSMLLNHGLVKFQKFESIKDSFPDPLGIGSPTLSLFMALFGEVVCAALVTVGLMTRLAVIPLVITMGVAFFVIHADDPFQKKELALAYLVGYSVILFRGAGKLSIDGLLSK